MVARWHKLAAAGALLVSGKLAITQGAETMPRHAPVADDANGSAARVSFEQSYWHACFYQNHWQAPDDTTDIDEPISPEAHPSPAKPATGFDAIELQCPFLQRQAADAQPKTETQIVPTHESITEPPATTTSDAGHGCEPGCTCHEETAVKTDPDVVMSADAIADVDIQAPVAEAAEPAATTDDDMSNGVDVECEPSPPDADGAATPAANAGIPEYDPIEEYLPYEESTEEWSSDGAAAPVDTPDASPIATPATSQSALPCLDPDCVSNSTDFCIEPDATGEEVTDVDAEAMDADSMDADSMDADSMDADAMDTDAMDADAMDADAMDADAMDADAIDADAIDALLEELGVGGEDMAEEDCEPADETMELSGELGDAAVPEAATPGTGDADMPAEDTQPAAEDAFEIEMDADTARLLNLMQADEIVDTADDTAHDSEAVVPDGKPAPAESVIDAAPGDEIEMMDAETERLLDLMLAEELVDTVDSVPVEVAGATPEAKPVQSEKVVEAGPTAPEPVTTPPVAPGAPEQTPAPVNELEPVEAEMADAETEAILQLMAFEELAETAEAVPAAEPLVARPAAPCADAECESNQADFSVETVVQTATDSLAGGEVIDDMNRANDGIDDETMTTPPPAQLNGTIEPVEEQTGTPVDATPVKEIVVPTPSAEGPATTTPTSETPQASPVDESTPAAPPALSAGETLRTRYHMFYPGPDWSRYELAAGDAPIIK
jgi:hypothetical protein